ncbi:Protein of unknown function, partial [Gryllus bimaculatus]
RGKREEPLSQSSELRLGQVLQRLCTAPACARGLPSDEDPRCSPRHRPRSVGVSGAPQDHDHAPRPSMPRVSPERDSSATTHDHDVFVCGAGAGASSQAHPSAAPGRRVLRRGGERPARGGQGVVGGRVREAAERAKRAGAAPQRVADPEQGRRGARAPVCGAARPPPAQGAAARASCSRTPTRNDDEPPRSPSPRRYQLLARADSRREARATGEPLPAHTPCATAEPHRQPVPSSRPRTSPTRRPRGGCRLCGASGAASPAPSAQARTCRAATTKAPAARPFPGRCWRQHLKTPRRPPIFSKLNYKRTSLNAWKQRDARIGGGVSVAPAAGGAPASPTRATAAAVLGADRAPSPRSPWTTPCCAGGYGRASSATSPPRRSRPLPQAQAAPPQLRRRRRAPRPEAAGDSARHSAAVAPAPPRRRPPPPASAARRRTCWPPAAPAPAPPLTPLGPAPAPTPAPPGGGGGGGAGSSATPNGAALQHWKIGNQQCEFASPDDDLAGPQFPLGDNSRKSFHGTGFMSIV